MTSGAGKKIMSKNTDTYTESGMTLLLIIDGFNLKLIV